MAVLWTAFVVYGLSTSPNAVPRYPFLALPGIDKFIHLVLFAIDGYFLTLAFAALRGVKLRFIIIGWGFFLGASTELMQHYWVEGRTGDVLDLVADILGSVLALTIYEWFSRK